MTPPDEGFTEVAAFDSLELELRKLPGVASVGFSGRDRHLTVHLAVPPSADRPWVRAEAEELARAHFDHPVSVAVDLLGEVPGPAAVPGDEDAVAGDRVLRAVANDWASSAAAAVLADVERSGAGDVPRAEAIEQPVERAEPVEVADDPEPPPVPPVDTVAHMERERVEPVERPREVPPVDDDGSSPRADPGRRVSDLASAQPRPRRTRPRVALLGVHVVEGGREVEVHLGHEARRTVGRGRAGKTASTASATLEALQDLGLAVPFTVRSAVRLGLGVDGAVAVILGGPGGDRLGLGRAATADHATVKATLQALNRFLEDPRSTGTEGP
jgi:hypothetical protein